MVLLDYRVYNKLYVDFVWEIWMTLFRLLLMLNSNIGLWENKVKLNIVFSWS